MNLPARMAWRYLFARKSTNAINIITLIAAFGVSIGAAALVLLLSVFNGFEDMFLGFFDNLNPDVQVSATKGKTFEIDEETYKGLYAIDGVAEVSRTLEETAMFAYGGNHSVGRIKGVDELYPLINGIDSLVKDGEYNLNLPESQGFGALVGNQLSMSLGVDPLNKFDALTVFMTRPRPRGAATSSTLTGRSGMIRREYQPTGIIRSMEAFGTQAVLIPISEARKLLSLGDNVVSSIEIKLQPGYITDDTYDRIQEYLGAEFVVKNRLQQESSILKIMQIEKWVGFAIGCLMMILISFNLIGALWMIVLEKKRDISILRSLGMTASDVRIVFLRVGLLLCGLGIAFGFFAALTIAVLQENFSLFRISGPMSEPYPIALRWMNFPVVAATVLGIGFLASILPARYAAKVKAIISEE